jgi:Lon-like protease
VRQRMTAGVGAVVLVVVVLALNFYRLPVVALSPGPAEDVLSRVKVQGATQVYDSKGRFYLTSVGIDDDVRFFEAILDLANRDVQLRARSDIYPQGESTQQVNQQNADDMDESKVLAAVVALRKLGYKVDPSAVDVTEVRPGAPADGKLKATTTWRCTCRSPSTTASRASAWSFGRSTASCPCRSPSTPRTSAGHRRA